MENIKEKQGKIEDYPNAMAMENPKQIFDRLIQTTVSEALVADAVELYAEKEIPDESDRDEFIEKYGDDSFAPIIKKAVLDVVVTVVAAHTVDSDDTFRAIVRMLEAEEKDDVIRRMKLVMLRKMIEDATGDIADQAAEQTFKARMSIMESAIG